MTTDNSSDKRPVRAPWERAFKRVLTPLEDFIHQETTSSLLLLLCTVVALVAANSDMREQYLHAIHTPIAISIGSARFELSLLHWVNEALMSFFFLLVGLELKRELLIGELADLRRASLPIVAAIGGMLVPAALYWCWNPSGVAAVGWGIPMATDIAFAIGVLSLLGSRIPSSLITFLIALAIVDDIGAVLVIAGFYTDTLHGRPLLICALLTALLTTLNLGGVRRLLPYMLIGILLWCAMLNSGLHATLAGVILAFTIPVRTTTDSSAQESEALAPAAERLHHHLHGVVAFLIVPLFALTNAAITIDWSNIAAIASHPVTAGVISGLVIGKWVGVVGASWLAIRLGGASLPDGLNGKHLHGIGLLAGIGFTMSIFVSDLAFSTAPEQLLLAKTGILLASTIAGVCGYCWLRIVGERQKIQP